MKTDLTIDCAFGKLNVRVAVLAEYNNKVLIQTMGDKCWLIGGRIQFGEDAHAAILREIAEELCYVPSDKDSLSLNFFCENFFNWGDMPCHEFLFVYRLILSDDSELVHKDNFKCCDNNQYDEKWFDFDELDKSGVVPNFISKYINQRDFMHCVIRNEQVVNV